MTDMARGKPRILGSIGAPGVGTTTFALAQVTTSGAPAAYLPMDGFHLAVVSLTALDRLPPQGRAGHLRRVGLFSEAGLVSSLSGPSTKWPPLAAYAVPMYDRDDGSGCEGGGGGGSYGHGFPNLRCVIPHHAVWALSA